MARRRVLTVACAAVLVLGACDSAFYIHGRITRCDDGTPLVAVRVALRLTAGVSSAEMSTAYTDPDGRYGVLLNEPPDASATMLVEKPGYMSATRSFDGAPDGVVDLCMTLAE